MTNPNVISNCGPVVKAPRTLGGEISQIYLLEVRYQYEETWSDGDLHYQSTKVETLSNTFDDSAYDEHRDVDSCSFQSGSDAEDQSSNANALGPPELIC